MKDAEYTRKGHIIRNAKGEVVFDGKSRLAQNQKGDGINLAKRESRRLQMESDRALGLGTLRLAS